MKKYTLIAIAVLIIGIAFWYVQNKTSTDEVIAESFVVGNPTDLVADFYSEWLDFVASTTTDPYTSLLQNHPFVSESLISRLQLLQPSERDLVLCQAETPPRVAYRELYTLPTEAQIIVIARGLAEPSGTQAVVTLAGNGEGGWYISNIECSQGETAPDVEFAFEQNGWLLKSVPAPYDDSMWHIVYEQNGTLGYVVPIEFTENSVCREINGSEAICQPDTFTEPQRILLQADMTEVGAIALRMEFLEQ